MTVRAIIEAEIDLTINLRGHTYLETLEVFRERVAAAAKTGRRPPPIKINYNTDIAYEDGNAEEDDDYE